MRSDSGATAGRPCDRQGAGRRWVRGRSPRIDSDHRRGVPTWADEHGAGGAAATLAGRRARRGCRTGSTPTPTSTPASRSGSSAGRLELRRAGLRDARAGRLQAHLRRRDAGGRGPRRRGRRCAARQPLRPPRACSSAMRDVGQRHEFICPYHQWIYDLDGRLVGGAVPPRCEGQRRHARRLRPGEHGLVPTGRDRAPRRRSSPRSPIAASDGELPPLEDYLGPDDARPTSTASSTAGTLRAARLPAPAGAGNWKLMFENIKDPYHASLLHVFLVTFGLFRADQPVVGADGRDRPPRRALSRSGASSAPGRHGRHASRSAPTCAWRDPRLLDPVREFRGAATVVMQTLWPNLIVQQQSNTLATRQLVTRGPRRVRPALDVLRLRRRRRGDAAAAPAPGQPDGPGGLRLDRRQRGDGAQPRGHRAAAGGARACWRWAGATARTPSTW